MASRLGLKRGKISIAEHKRCVACGVASRLGLKQPHGDSYRANRDRGLWSGFPPGIETDKNRLTNIGARRWLVEWLPAWD